MITLVNLFKRSIIGRSYRNEIKYQMAMNRIYLVQFVKRTPNGSKRIAFDSPWQS